MILLMMMEMMMKMAVVVLSHTLPNVFEKSAKLTLTLKLHFCDEFGKTFEAAEDQWNNFKGSKNMTHRIKSFKIFTYTAGKYLSSLNCCKIMKFKETERGPWTDCTSWFIQNILGKEMLRVEQRRAHICELTLNKNFKSSCICFQFSTSDISYYVFQAL